MIERIIEHCTRINLHSPNTILIVSALIFLIAGIGVTKLKIDFNFLTEFKPHVEFRQHTEVAEREMGGILSLTYIVDTGKEGGIKEPKVLKAIDKLQHYAEQDPLVKKTFSAVDIIKDLNRSFNQDNHDYYRLPDERDLTAQYFLLYEMSGGEELEEFVTKDYSRGVLQLRVEVTDSSKIKALVDRLDAFLIDNPIPEATVSKTGIGLMWMKMAEYISRTQIASYSLIFLVVAIFMSISFGSIKVGLLSMIPNVAPVVITLGAMGWYDIHLDYMKLLLATIAIGIAVDDTIHLVTRYRSRFLELGSYEEALKTSLQDVGPALLITSIILIVSFSSFLLSVTTILSSFGLLLAATIAIALLADLFTLPALFLKLKPFGPEFSKK